MHKHHGDHGRGKKIFACADLDGDWERPRSRHDRDKFRRTRHKPYERYSRSNRIDWLEDLDSEYF